MNKDQLRLQKALKADGFDPGTVDGVWGPKSQAALDAWREAARHLPKGIDVSRWQGHDIKWAEVASGPAGVAYAYVKATDGAGSDPLFKENWAEIKAAGLLRGAYHFFRPGRSLQSQADRVFAAVGKLQPGDLPVAIDVERDDAGPDGIDGTSDDLRSTDAQIEAFAVLVEQKTGRKPLVYSYGPFLDGHNIEVPSLGLWIADYRMGPPTVPPGWKGYLFHQYAGDSGTQPGIKGAVDLNRFRGEISALRSLAGL